MRILALMIGTPGSGKTTLRNSLFTGATVICPDEYIGYTKENPWTFKAAGSAWKKARQLFKEALNRDDELIIFDATMITPKKRKVYINLAAEKNIKTIAVFCNTPSDICRQRNNSRDGYRKVPDVAIEKMASSLVAPSLSEGFLFIIDSTDDKLTVRPKTIMRADYPMINWSALRRQ